jgi:D-alanyl-D-alanine carboxypeptidase/D-alanyl-D-alanine-endopeptidase (penicillin-binding protein 4)
VASFVVFLLLAAGALFAGTAAGSQRAASAVQSQTATATPEPQPSRVVPATIPGATPVRTCSVSALAKDDLLANFAGHVTNIDTGDVLFSRNGDEPQRTASVLKLLTASAALQVLGPDYRMSTRVIAGPTPGSVVLVGGGDPTLSRTASGSDSFYVDAPKVSDLASQVRAAVGPDVPITSIVLDSTYWSSDDKWDPTWARSEQELGYMSEVTALQVDGDRADPRKATSPRSTDPVMNAGKAFAAALGVPDAQLTLGEAADGAQQLAEVQSQPLATLIRTMLLTSDNTLSESIARVTSLEAGDDGSAASLDRVVPNRMAALGLDANELTITDGSGLSDRNAVSPAFVTSLVELIDAGNNDLDVVFDSLPVAGQSGSLASRFTGDNAVARGKVLAKTGWIESAYTLAGVVEAQDGTSLAFAFYAIGDDVTVEARTALDTLTTAVYRCGDNLSDR